LPEALLRDALRHKLLDFLCTEGVLDAELAQRIRKWRHSGFSVHNRVHTKADDAERRQRLSRYMIRCPFSLEKMRYAADSGMVIYRSKPHATLKRNYQLMSALKWLRLLMNHIPDRYELLVHYYGYYSNRSRAPADSQGGRSRPSMAFAALAHPCAAYEVDPLECVNCGSNMRIIALIDDVDVVERILRHLNRWDPQPDTLTPAGPDPPLPLGETLPLTYHPVPDIA